MRFGFVLSLVLVPALSNGSNAFWDTVTDQCLPPALQGTGIAIDGDTLMLTPEDGRGTVLRLISIDAPELFQECRDIN